MKEKNLFYLCVAVLLLNVLFLDFIYIAKIGNISSFDPIIGNEDYLRHHSIARQVSEGQGFFSIYDSSLNQMPYIYGQPIPSLYYGFVLFLTSNSTFFTFFITLILFSIFSFIFLNKFITKIVEDKKKSYFITTILLITGNFIFSFWYLIPKGVIQIDSIIMLHRIANPLISYPFLFLFIYLLYNYYENYLNNDFEKIKKLSLYLGLIFFLLIFSYFYFWTFAFVSFALVNLFLFFKDKKKRFKEFIYSNLLFAIFSIPALIIYLYNSYLQNKILFYKEYLERNNVIFTHQFLSSEYEIFYLFILIIMIIIFIYLYKKEILEKSKLNFLVVLFISGYICLYNNVITGLSVQKGHWFAFIIYPLFLLILILFCFEIYQKYIFKYVKINNILFYVLILITIFNLFFIIQIGNKEYSNYIISNSQKELFEYLNNLDSKKIILADSKNSRNIVGYTFHDTIFVDEIEKVSNIELQKRQKIFENYTLNCISKMEFDYIIIENKSLICTNIILEKEFEGIKLYKNLN